MDCKLVIIGAGASGIAAATKALELGFSNIILLEAENRIGGRIFNINNIELGSYWCNPKDTTCEKRSIGLRTLFQNTCRYKYIKCIRSNKDVVTQDICTKLHQIIAELLKKRQDLLKLYDSTLKTYLIKNFTKSLENPEYSNINKTLAEEFLEFYLKLENFTNWADNFYDESANDNLNSCDLKADEQLRSNEFDYITLNSLMKSTKEKKFGILHERLFLNKKVKEIEWSQNADIQTVITCVDGFQIQADHVFCTVSLGVLKENYLSLFKPALPLQKIKAIEGLSFDTVNTIFLEFSKPFWCSDWYGYTMLWSENDLKEIRGRHDNWIADTLGFFTVDHLENTLCALIVGESGRIMEMASEDEVLDSCVFLLKKFLQWEIPIPIKIKRSAWNTNSNFRGSYAFTSRQTDHFNTSPFYLSSPILNNNGIPIIQFCGDATHYQYYSTVAGAMESGWREAKRLADIYLM